MRRIFRARSAVGIVGIAAVLASSPARSAEGMWTLDNPPTRQMQAELGWAPDAAWLQRAMRGAARLGGGCSASFVSKSGLVLSNHHCAAGCIGQLSSAGSDLMKDGFLARVASEERRCPALDVSRLERITDVTTEVTKATDGLAGTAFKAAQNAVKANLTSACAAGDARYRCDVVDLYHGGQYMLYRYRRFDDVRLVFAPERAIAFFGGDPDNFNFPRYDLDMAIVRVYEGNEPAKIDDWFRISANGPVDAEPVFVVGHPGATRREITVAQIAQLRDQAVVYTLLRLAEYRGLLLRYTSEGEEPMRIGKNELFGVENYYKATRGRLEALLDDQFMVRKKADEALLRSFVAAHPELASTAGAWDAIAAAVQIERDLYREYRQVEEADAFQTRYFAIARLLVRGTIERAKPNDRRLPEFNDNRLSQVDARLMSPAPIYPALERLSLTFGLVKFRETLGADAPIVRKVLGSVAPERMAQDFIGRTRLGDVAYRRQLWDGGPAAVAASDDPFVQLALLVDPEARAIRSRFEREVEAPIQASTEKIAKARFAMSGTSISPDATGSLRLSYGTVKGWTEAGRPVAPFTTFAGAYARATGAEPFALPPSWTAAKGRVGLGKPLNLVSTNDTIGGNSGSPVLDRKGELVGLAFDGNIHSLGGDFWYDAGTNRSVSVDSVAILEALEHIYDAKALASELMAR